MRYEPMKSIYLDEQHLNDQLSAGDRFPGSTVATSPFGVDAPSIDQVQMHLTFLRERLRNLLVRIETEDAGRRVSREYGSMVHLRLLYSQLKQSRSGELGLYDQNADDQDLLARAEVCFASK